MIRGRARRRAQREQARRERLERTAKAGRLIRLRVASLDERRPDCRCQPWEQRWRPETPHLCSNCGGLFPHHTVAARR